MRPKPARCGWCLRQRRARSGRSRKRVFQLSVGELDNAKPWATEPTEKRRERSVNSLISRHPAKGTKEGCALTQSATFSCVRQLLATQTTTEPAPKGTASQRRPACGAGSRRLGQVGESQPRLDDGSIGPPAAHLVLPGLARPRRQWNRSVPPPCARCRQRCSKATGRGCNPLSSCSSTRSLASGRSRRG